MGADAARVPDTHDARGQCPPAAAPPLRSAVDDGHHLARGAAANAWSLRLELPGVFIFLICAIARRGSARAFQAWPSRPPNSSSKAGMRLRQQHHPVHGAAGRVRRRRRRATRVQARGGHCGRRPHRWLRWCRFRSWMAGGDARLDAILTRRSGDAAGAAGHRCRHCRRARHAQCLAMSSEFYSRGSPRHEVTTEFTCLAIALGVRDVAPALAVVLGTTAVQPCAQRSPRVRSRRGWSPGRRGGRLQQDLLRPFRPVARCCAFRCPSPARAC